MSLSNHIAGILGASLALTLLVRCGAGTPTPLEQSEVLSYSAGEVGCVQVGATKADIDGCRNAIKSYWCGKGGPLYEAGACVYPPPVDGGAQ
jgi:hypothetical protein